MANNVSPLEEAALSGDIDRLYALIKEDPDILNDLDAKSIVNTPLHIAAASVDLRTNPELELKYLYFATEIMVLMPSFASKLNQQGLSPIHLALQNGHSKLARRLVNMNEELVRVKGREGTTPLHVVCQIGDCDLLAYFLSACPDSIEDVNTRDETALHVAVRYQQFDALRVLVGWLKGNTRKDAANLETSILNRRDVEGNTILHLSVIHDNIQALNLLIKNHAIMDIYLNVKNSEKKTALDEATTGDREDMKDKLSEAGARPGSSFEDDPTWTPADRLMSKSRHNFSTILSAALTSIRRTRENISDNKRDAYLVVAALILTAIYQSALSPPGGLYQADGSNLNATLPLNSAAGKSVLSSSNFGNFAAINLLALTYTTVAFLILIPEGTIGFVLVAPTFYFAVSYVYSLVLTMPPLPETTREHQSAARTTILIVIVLSGLLVARLLNGFSGRVRTSSFTEIIINKYISGPLLKMFRRIYNASNI